MVFPLLSACKKILTGLVFFVKRGIGTQDEILPLRCAQSLRDATKGRDDTVEVKTEHAEIIGSTDGP
jgi:hypothetical protein